MNDELAARNDFVVPRCSSPEPRNESEPFIKRPRLVEVPCWKNGLRSFGSHRCSPAVIAVPHAQFGLHNTLMVCSHLSTSSGHSVVIGSEVGRIPNA